jgi:maintenance of morphology protein 1
LSFIPSADPPKDEPGQEEDSGRTRSPTTLAFSFDSDYRLDLSVRSLVGSRSRLQDVPKIAQIVEARIHQWFDERCVEPRVQQIILPSLWPRKRNTRGGEEEDDDSSVAEEDVADELTSNPNGNGNGSKESMKDVSNDNSLEARMTAEGQKLREAESKEQRSKDGQTHPTLRRRPGHISINSTENFRIPGRFE